MLRLKGGVRSTGAKVHLILSVLKLMDPGVHHWVQNCHTIWRSTHVCVCVCVLCRVCVCLCACGCVCVRLVSGRPAFVCAYIWIYSVI